MRIEHRTNDAVPTAPMADEETVGCDACESTPISPGSNGGVEPSPSEQDRGPSQRIAERHERCDPLDCDPLAARQNVTFPTSETAN